jgi:hypothetical protein
LGCYNDVLAVQLCLSHAHLCWFCFNLSQQAGGGRSFVLRKKPPGHVLPSAHAVEREARILAALQDTPVPVPRVVGSVFLSMPQLQLRAPTFLLLQVHAAPPGLPTLQRPAACLLRIVLSLLPLLTNRAAG